MDFIVSFFPCLIGVDGKQSAVSLNELSKMLTAHQVRESKDGELFSFARYDLQHVRRGNEYIQAVSGLVIDVDNTVGRGKDSRLSDNPSIPEDHESNLADFCYGFYSTHSHRSDWPKWRLWMPLSRPLHQGEFFAAHAGLRALMADDSNIDMSCAEIARAYYLPSCPPEFEPIAFAGFQEKRIVRPEELFECSSIAPTYNERVRNVAESMGRNNALKHIAGGMIGRGRLNDEIVMALIQEDRRLHSPPLFDDPNEISRADAYTNASVFVSNIRKSINVSQVRRGQTPHIPYALSAPPPEEKTEAAPQRFEGTQIPSELLQLPGALGELVDEINATAKRPQPQFAVLTALAIGCTVLGRRYISTYKNVSTLYFLAVAKSSSGKEMCREISYQVLNDVGMDHLIGPASYTAEGSLYESLVETPAHLTVIDEFGEYLKSAAKQGMAIKATVIEKLKEIWGLRNGMLRRPQYSTRGMSKKEKDTLKQTEKIFWPSPIVVGLTTPEQFYDALTPGSIEGGFLARFIICESSVGRQNARLVRDFSTPESFKQWCKDSHSLQDGNLAGLEFLGTILPKPYTVHFETGALEYWTTVVSSHNEMANALDRTRLSEVVGRDPEKILRIALVLAVSRNVFSPIISLSDIQWAEKFIRYYTQQTLSAINRNMHANAFSKTTQRVFEFIFDHGEKGVSRKDLLQGCRAYSGERQKERAEILAELRIHGFIRVNIANGERFYAIRRPD